MIRLVSVGRSSIGNLSKDDGLDALPMEAKCELILPGKQSRKG